LFGLVEERMVGSVHSTLRVHGGHRTSCSPGARVASQLRLWKLAAFWRHERIPLHGTHVYEVRFLSSHFNHGSRNTHWECCHADCTPPLFRHPRLQVHPSNQNT
jgi:hypothetical protein